VTRAKQLKIARAAGIFLTREPTLARGPCRFDVVSIDGDDTPRIHWLKDAFQPEAG
jgi:putative endonuclease